MSFIYKQPQTDSFNNKETKSLLIEEQTEFAKVIMCCFLSPILCKPLCIYNECIRICYNKCNENKIPPIGLIQDNTKKSTSTKVCSCFYTQEPSYTTTLCCVHYHIYDPCS